MPEGLADNDEWGMPEDPTDDGPEPEGDDDD